MYTTSVPRGGEEESVGAGEGVAEVVLPTI